MCRCRITEVLKGIVRDEQEEGKAGCFCSVVSAATCSPCDNSVTVISTLIYHLSAKDSGMMDSVPSVVGTLQIRNKKAISASNPKLAI